MKKPFLHAFVAALYIVSIVLVIFQTGQMEVQETVIIPMLMLSLFVFSAAVMGYLFLAEPLQLFLENRKEEAVAFFSKTVMFFACFIVVFVILTFLNSTLILW